MHNSTISHANIMQIYHLYTTKYDLDAYMHNKCLMYAQYHNIVLCKCIIFACI